MHRICLRKSDGRLIEMQSGGDDNPAMMDARLDTLRQNAISAGYKEDEIDVKWIDEAEWRQIQSADEARWHDPQKEAAEAMIKAKMRELAVKALEAEGKLTADGKTVA